MAGGPVERSLALREYASRVRSLSLSMGIPSINQEEGFILYAVTAVVASKRSKVHVVDAGAGIGYSTIWLGQALEDFCRGTCRLTAIEWDESKASRAREVLDGMKWSRVEWSVVSGDALDVVESMEDSSLSLAFVDVEKSMYPKMLEILERKLEPGGVALFHNAYFPPPPPAFYDQASRDPWVSAIIPTPEGLYIIAKRG